jgi:SAM-dependent methyltransferase
MTADPRRRLGAYYTPPHLVAHALDTLPSPPTRARVADLACGEGAWLAEAAARWPAARLVGVDLDRAALARAALALGDRVELRAGDGATERLGPLDLVVGNPPWGAGRAERVRRGQESASRFVARALTLLAPGGRLCLLLPAAWLEVAAHGEAREALLGAAAIERIEHLGHVFPGVLAPAALLVARREPDAAARAASPVWTARGPVAQAVLAADGALHARLAPAERALLGCLDARGQRLGGRATFVLGVVTGGNRAALAPADDGRGEPIVAGREVEPFRIRPPARRLVLPLARVQQAAPIAAYRRRKVVYRFIAAHPVAAVDCDGRLTLNSANAIAPDDPTLEPEFLAAALNSAPVRFADRARRSLPRLLRSHLERLPLPRADAAGRRCLAQLAADGRRDELDDLVMGWFGLGPAERALVRSACPTY